MKKAVLVVVCALTLAPGGASRAAAGQFGDVLKRGAKGVEQFRDVQMTDEEEQKLGQSVSEKIRTRYGVVQDPAIHKYVTLVGLALAQASTRPSLTWHFIVLDTDGVNALAAPGGYVHITRGALSLMKNEAELAGVLGHEIIHVTEKHTIRAIQKGKLVQMGANESLSNSPKLFNDLVNKATDVVMAGFGRAEELESDSKGVVLASKLGYEPDGLNAFLTTISERNKDSSEKQGLFASHPQMQERQDKLTAAAKKLSGSAVLDARFRQNVTYKPVALTAITTVAPGAAGLAGGSEGKGKDAEASKTSSAKTEDNAEPPKKKGFGLGKLVKGGSGPENQSAQNSASGGSRGLDKERNAKGGSNPNLVTVKVTPSELASFKKEGQLS